MSLVEVSDKDDLKGRRYLAIRLPYLSAERARLTGACPAAKLDEPLAFVSERRGTTWVSAVDAHALNLGLVPGMPLADARARYPTVFVLPHDPMTDAAWLSRIAVWSERYTPMVALDPPLGVILDITGCGHLWKGEATLAEAVTTLLCRASFTACLGLAATPAAARGLAQFAPSSLDETENLLRLPIAALRLDADSEAGLRRAGLTRVGDLATRPTAPLAARFAAAAEALDRLLGRAEERITPLRPLPALFVDQRFSEPLTDIDSIVTTLEALARRVASGLSARHAGGRNFVASLFRLDGEVREITVETSRPNRDPMVLSQLFAERLATLDESVDPGCGFDLIRLAVPAIEPMTAAQRQFNDGVSEDDTLTALLDRLSIRLGPEHVRRYVPRDSHIPERAIQGMPARQIGTVPGWEMPPRETAPPRPIRLFDPPCPIEVKAMPPVNAPSLFRWRRATYRIRRHEGPERISAEWWRNDGFTRDYYRVEDEVGRRFWIYRDGLEGIETERPRWYLHGLFA